MEPADEDTPTEQESKRLRLDTAALPLSIIPAPVSKMVSSIARALFRDVKMVILLRTDLGMGKGKMVAQGSHATLKAYQNALKSPEGKELVSKWESTGQAKIALKVDSLALIEGFVRSAAEAKLPFAVVRDAGLTQLEPGTITAMAIGPADASKIDKITGSLKLL